MADFKLNNGGSNRLRLPSETNGLDDIIRNRSVSFNTQSDSINIELANQPMKPENRNETTPLNDSELLLAATYVQDAMYGRTGVFKTEIKEVRRYNLYHKFYFRIFLFVTLFVNLSLVLFEEPAVPNLAVPWWGTMIIELACLIIFIVRLAHSKTFTPGIRWVSDKKNIAVTFVMGVTLMDMIIYMVMVLCGYEDKAIRWSRFLRPIFVINFDEGREIRRAFRNIRNTLPEIVSVLVLLLSMVALFALMALKLFENKNLVTMDGSPYLSNYWDNYWELYVLVTTANSPDVMMPAYNKSGPYSIFFITYVLICTYIFMSIFLAVVYNNYRKHLKTEVYKSVYIKRRKLNSAFKIVMVNIEGKFALPWSRWKALLKAVNPDRSEAQARLLWHVLDTDQDGLIQRGEFLKIAELLNVELIEIKDTVNCFQQYFGACYSSRISLYVINVVRNEFFRYFFDVLIVVNAVFIGIGKDAAENFFLPIFTVEILLRLYAAGIREFFRDGWNIFDFTIIAAAIIGTMIDLLDRYLISEVDLTLDIILVLRVLRLVRVFNNFEKFKVILTTLFNIGPSIVIYGAVILVFYYAFAILGMEIFEGKIHFVANITEDSQDFCQNSLLEGSEFVREQYCKNNFNDFLSAMVFLFELMVVNQWHILTGGHVLVTNKAARIYFTTFHIVVVIIALNIFVAFVLEVFILQYTLNINKSAKIETAIEEKIHEMGMGVGEDPILSKLPRKKEDKKKLLGMNDNEEFYQEEEDITSEDLADSSFTNMRFRLVHAGSKKVEVLLQQLFEEELDIEDEGPKDIEDIENQLPEQDIMPTPFTLDNIT